MIIELSNAIALHYGLTKVYAQLMNDNSRVGKLVATKCNKLEGVVWC